MGNCATCEEAREQHECTMEENPERRFDYSMHHAAPEDKENVFDTPVSKRAAGEKALKGTQNSPQ